MMNIQMRLIAVLGTLALTACAVSDTQELDNSSSTKGYTHSQLISNSGGSHAKAKQATTLLKNNGWCKIQKQHLPRGWTHDQLVRQMACIANKESTFGKAPTGPYMGAGSCGTPYGYWQIAQCHMGKRYGAYSCPTRSSATLRDDWNVSAKCALYVYMERAGRGRSGLGPWEATCSIRERDQKLANGQFLFPSACGEGEGANLCKDSLKTRLLENGTVMYAEVSSKCPATKIGYQLLNADRADEDISPKYEAVLQEDQSVKRVMIRLEKSKNAHANMDFSHIRLHLERNTESFYTTNPSLPL